MNTVKRKGSKLVLCGTSGQHRTVSAAGVGASPWKQALSAPETSSSARDWAFFVCLFFYIINEALVSVKKCLPPVIFLIPDDTCFPPSSVNAAHPCSVCLFFNYCINARKPEKYGSSQTPTHTISHVVAHFTFI